MTDFTGELSPAIKHAVTHKRPPQADVANFSTWLHALLNQDSVGKALIAGPVFSLIELPLEMRSLSSGDCQRLGCGQPFSRALYEPSKQ